MGGGEGEKRPRGRPKGSGNKRRADLARYIEAVHGSTPGEQLAKACMVTRSELRAAKGDVLEAVMAKAERVAKRMSMKKADALAMLLRGQAELLAYVHQKQPQAIVASGSGFAPAVLIVGQEGPAQQAPMQLEEDEAFQPVIEGEAREVSRVKSHGAQQALGFIEEPDA